MTRTLLRASAAFFSPEGTKDQCVDYLECADGRKEAQQDGKSSRISRACKVGLSPGPSPKVVQAKPSESLPALLKKSAAGADEKCPRCFAP